MRRLRRSLRHLLLTFFMALLAVSGVAHAGPIAGAGARLFWESEGHERRFDTRIPWRVLGGWGWERSDVLLEYATYHDSDAVGIASIYRQQQELLTWYRYRFAPVGGDVIPTLAAGSGMQREVIRTRFASETVKNAGAPQVMFALATGAMVKIGDHVQAGLEFRAAFSETFAPNPTLGIGGTLGFQFW